MQTTAPSIGDPSNPLPAPADVLPGTREYAAHPASLAFVHRVAKEHLFLRAEDITVLWLGRHLALVRLKNRKRGTLYHVVDRHRFEVADPSWPDVKYRIREVLPEEWAKAQTLPTTITGPFGPIYATVVARHVPRRWLGAGKDIITAWVEVLTHADGRYGDRFLAERADETTRAERRATLREQFEADRRAQAREKLLALSAPSLVAAVRTGVAALARTLAERPAAQAAGLNLADVLAGKPPERAGGAWTSLRQMQDALAAAGEPAVTPEEAWR